MLSFNETFLLVNPDLNLCVRRVTALVTELHRGPVVICAALWKIKKKCSAPEETGTTEVTGTTGITVGLLR